MPVKMLGFTGSGGEPRNTTTMKLTPRTIQTVPKEASRTQNHVAWYGACARVRGSFEWQLKFHCGWRSVANVV